MHLELLAGAAGVVAAASVATAAAVALVVAVARQGLRLQAELEADGVRAGEVVPAWRGQQRQRRWWRAAGSSVP